MAEQQEVQKKSILEIDKYALDEEWVAQPKRVEKYAAKAAEAKFDLAEAKAFLDATRVKLCFAIRKNPQHYGLTKATEGSVNDKVIELESYQEALRAVNEAKRTVDYLDGILEALEHKKKALENLVYLHGQSYFGPREIKPKDRKKTGP